MLSIQQNLYSAEIKLYCIMAAFSKEETEAETATARLR